ncbi:MAG: UPF0175 family protein [Candidatus Nanohaloarchaea archaeon]|nr:UPF0175 family protein [Candidatus Nanohaloarchaea archaeon]
MSSAKIVDMELEEAKKIGFKSKEDFVKSAIETYLASRDDKRLELAIALYEDGKISIGKAVEIAGINIEDFKAELDNRGVKRPTLDAEKGKNAALNHIDRKK